MKDGETVAIYMLPKGADMPFPPAACTSFNEISDQNSAILSKNSPCRADRRDDHHAASGDHHADPAATEHVLTVRRAS